MVYGEYNLYHGKIGMAKFVGDVVILKNQLMGFSPGLS